MAPSRVLRKMICSLRAGSDAVGSEHPPAGAIARTPVRAAFARRQLAMARSEGDRERNVVPPSTGSELRRPASGNDGTRRQPEYRPPPMVAAAAPRSPRATPRPAPGPCLPRLGEHNMVLRLFQRSDTFI